MTLRTKSVLEYGLAETVNVLNSGFSDYIVPVQMDMPHFFEFLRIAIVDIALSKIILRDKKPIGVALIARRGWNCRLAGMSIIPEARGQHVGQWLMAQIIDEAKERGDHRMELEVIKQNEPAVKLYQKIGFQLMRRLTGYKNEAPTGAYHPLAEIDPLKLANLVNLYGLSNLPWQLSGESLAPKGPPHKAFQLGSAFAAITNPDADQIIINAVLTLPKARGEGQAARLVSALFAQYPGKIWSAPAIYPEEMGGFFEKLGFKLQTLSQFQMELNFE